MRSNHRAVRAVSFAGDLYVEDFATSGGFIAYGSNQLEQWRSAAGYVDRILEGEKPSDLPVQAPSKE